MNKELWNFQSPDLVWRSETYQVLEPFNGEFQIIKVGKKYKVYAERVSTAHFCGLMGSGAWACRRPYNSPHPGRNGVCGYYPGSDYMPPLPGQVCHNCKGLLCEEVI